jgi:putative transposase
LTCLTANNQSISELITDVDDYIEFYSHQRFHETLAYKKPMDVYQESIKLNQGKKEASSLDLKVV